MTTSQDVGSGSIALVPELALGAVPEDVVLVRPSQQLERQLLAVTRTGQLRNAGIDRLVDAVRTAMSARIGTVANDR